MNLEDEIAVAIDCGGDALMGIAHPTAARNEVGAVFVVGGPQYRVGSHRMFVDLARSLAVAGIPVLRFDCRGMGDSDGTFVSFENLEDDIRAAVDAAEHAIGVQRMILVGLCDGASASAMYAAKDPRISAVVLMNPWVRSPVGEAKARINHYYGGQLRQWDFWRRLFTGNVDVASSIKGLLGNVGLAVQARGEAASDYIGRMLQGIVKFRSPILILLSRDDLTAQEFTGLIADSAAWKDAVHRPNVTLSVIDGADHTFSGRAQIERAAAEIVAFGTGAARHGRR